MSTIEEKYNNDMERFILGYSEKPDFDARCYCGVKTKWIFDEEFQQFDSAMCWLCNTQFLMKVEMTSKNFAGILTEEQAQKFIEYVMKNA